MPCSSTSGWIRTRYDSRLVAGRVGDAEGDYLALARRRAGDVRVGARARPPGRAAAGLVGVLVAGPAHPLVPPARRPYPHGEGGRPRPRRGRAVPRPGRRAHLPRARLRRVLLAAQDAAGGAGGARARAAASALVAVTERVRRDVLARGIGRPDQVVVVPLGLDLDPLAGARRRGAASCAPSSASRRRRRSSASSRALVPVKAHEVVPARRRGPSRRSGPTPCSSSSATASGGPSSRRSRASRPGRSRPLPRLARRPRLALRRPRRRGADLEERGLAGRPDRGDGGGRPVVSTRAGGVEDVVTDGETGRRRAGRRRRGGGARDCRPARGSEALAATARRGGAASVVSRIRQRPARRRHRSPLLAPARRRPRRKRVLESHAEMSPTVLLVVTFAARGGRSRRSPRSPAPRWRTGSARWRGRAAIAGTSGRFRCSAASRIAARDAGGDGARPRPGVARCSSIVAGGAACVAVGPGRRPAAASSRRRS